MAKKVIRIAFCGFGDNFKMENFQLVRLMSSKYDFQFSEVPDYIFYTPADNMHHNFDCIRIFWTGENVIPNFNYCDYAIGFAPLSFGDRYLRYPLWVQYKEDIRLALKKQIRWIRKPLYRGRFVRPLFPISIKQTAFVKKCLRFYQAINQLRPVVSGVIPLAAPFLIR